MDPRYGRQPKNFFQGEDQGAIHHAVNQQAMLGRIDPGNPRMVPLKMKG